MRMEAYLRVAGDQKSICSLGEETRDSGASLKQLKVKREETEDEYWWSWQTERVRLELNGIDEGVQRLMKSYQRYFTAIKKHRSEESVTVLEIVTYYQPNDRPEGIFLSAETLSLLSEIGAALDNDVVPDVTNRGESF